MKVSMSIFSLFCGVAMLGTWTLLLGTGQFPELHSRPFETWFLLLAEGLTASTLILSGYGRLTGKIWGQRSQLAGLGMLQYCSVLTIGVCAQAGSLPGTIFFVVIASLTAIFVSLIVRESFIKGDLK